MASHPHYPLEKRKAALEAIAYELKTPELKAKFINVAATLPLTDRLDALRSITDHLTEFELQKKAFSMAEKGSLEDQAVIGGVMLKRDQVIDVSIQKKLIALWKKTGTGYGFQDLAQTITDPALQLELFDYLRTHTDGPHRIGLHYLMRNPHANSRQVLKHMLDGVANESGNNQYESLKALAPKMNDPELKQKYTELAKSMVYKSWAGRVSTEENEELLSLVNHIDTKADGAAYESCVEEVSLE